MSIEIVMPRLGWTMEEGIFGGWLKQDGERIEAGDQLFTVETDKATQEIEAFHGGILRVPPAAPKVGDVVPVGQIVGYLVQAGEPAPFEFGLVTGPASVSDTAAPVTPTVPSARSGGRTVAARRGGLPAISPRARRVADELGVAWTMLQGSGRTGRIVERDVRAAHAQQAMAQPDTAKMRISPLAQRMAEAEGIDLAALAQQTPGRRIQREDVEAAVAARSPAADQQESLPRVGVGENIPISRIRQLIAQRMVDSAQTTAAVTLTTEADASELVALRAQFKAALGGRGQAVPSYNDLLIKLTATALQEHPLLNATWREGEILLHDRIHIGLAVDTEQGLLVPVVRDAQDKSLRRIGGETARLVEAALAHRLGPDDLQGGTFTITNLGMYGIDAFTPIIPLPQCAILGAGRIVARPWVVDNQIVPRQIMALSLTFDHRIVDGGPAARFLNTLREYVETPALWLAA
jgi:pyruvate dehydrogenase E2 component (dihydrolipoamide acetyltransferase)